MSSPPPPQPPPPHPPSLQFHEGCYCYRPSEVATARSLGLPIRCGGGLPCACTPIPTPTLPDEHHLNTHDMQAAWDELLEPLLTPTSPTSNKRPRPAPCTCPCAALHAAAAAAAKQRKCCGGNCRCPPGLCRCPQTAVTTAFACCQPPDPATDAVADDVAAALSLQPVPTPPPASCCQVAHPSLAPPPLPIYQPVVAAGPSSCCAASSAQVFASPAQVGIGALSGLLQSGTYAEDPGPAAPVSAPPPRVVPVESVGTVVSPGKSPRRRPRGGIRAASFPGAGPSPARDRTFACDRCSSTFFFKQNRDRHINEVHLGRRPHKCDYAGCEGAFKNRSGLKQHQRTVHEKARPFKCVQCSSAFGQRNHLTQHVLVVHEKVKMYTCHLCDMTFSNVGNRTQHVRRRHSGKRVVSKEAGSQTAPHMSRVKQDESALQIVNENLNGVVLPPSAPVIVAADSPPKAKSEM